MSIFWNMTLLPCAACCTILASCASAPTHVYGLAVVPGPMLAAYHGAPVRVNAVHVPPILDRTELMREIGPQEYRIQDGSHWGAPLGETAAEVLSADLIERLPRDRVIFPRLTLPPDGLGIVVDILRLDIGLQGASLEASWVIDNSESRSEAFRASRRWHIDSTTSDSAGTVQALSDLLGKLADQLVVDLADLQGH